MSHVIIFIDFVGSVAFKMEHGSNVANKKLEEWLDDIRHDLHNVDPTIRISGPSEGDSLLLIGTDIVEIFKSLIMRQHTWKVFRSVIALPIRISIGWGDFETMPSGSLRGMEIDVAHRILAHCDVSGVVVTNAAREKIADAGYRYKLIERHAHLKGRGIETFWHSNGTWKAVERRSYAGCLDHLGVKVNWQLFTYIGLWSLFIMGITLALSRLVIT